MERIRHDMTVCHHRSQSRSCLQAARKPLLNSTQLNFIIEQARALKNKKTKPTKKTKKQRDSHT